MKHKYIAFTFGLLVIFVAANANLALASYSKEHSSSAAGKSSVKSNTKKSTYESESDIIRKAARALRSEQPRLAMKLDRIANKLEK